MQSQYVDNEALEFILRLLTYDNMLVCCVALQTGLRISDVLSLRSDDIKKKSFTITEQKTGKKRKIRLSEELRQELISISGKIYVFPHRTDENRHRTRQAVYKDIRRACKALRISDNITPHSLRKNYAVSIYKKYGDISVVQKALNHDNELVTLLYALSDKITKKVPRHSPKL